MIHEPTDTRAATRRRGLIVAGTITLAVTAWVALQTEDTPLAAPRPRAGVSTREPAPRAAAPASTPADTWPDAPAAQRRESWPAAAALGVAAWSPPAPPPAPPAPPAPKPVVAAVQPQAPPFPYTLIGRLDDGEPRALLSGPLRSFGAKAADVIDGAWRVDTVDAQGMTVTWLPAGLKRAIPFASS